MRIVIKIGSSLLTNADHTLNRSFLREIISQVVTLNNEGHEVAIVSSGAVASGRSGLTFEHESKKIPYRQALAAVGQPVLMEAYRELLALHGITVAQALLTNYDFTNRENFLNTKNVFETLFEKHVIPIVNENDVTTIAELKFGDNDMLSAKTAGMVSANILCILTDVDGLFDDNPKKNPEAKLLPVVKKMSSEIHELASGKGSLVGTGGMVTKLAAAEYVTSVGIAMFIVNGHKKNAILDAIKFAALYEEAKNGDGNKIVESQKVGTFFIPSAKAISSEKKWLRPKIQKNACIDVDAGAARAINQMGKSLLPSGIVGVHGEFERGDVINVRFEEKIIAYGQVNYASTDLEKIKKHRSDEIEHILGFNLGDEVMHRDRMAVQN